jgi:hypothetical protein
MKAMFAAVLLALVIPVHAGEIIVEDPWIREAPPTMSMLGGFMKLHNKSDRERNIVSAEGADFGWIEVHRTMMQDGMARMVPQEQITIPAGGMVELKPGDFHLMLMQPKRQLKAGDMSKIIVKFADGESMAIDLTVRQAGGMMMHHH